MAMRFSLKMMNAAMADEHRMIGVSDNMMAKVTISIGIREYTQHGSTLVLLESSPQMSREDTSEAGKLSSTSEDGYVALFSVIFIYFCSVLLHK
ncbi:hypothetical protein QQ045_023816 [Rhodiola kirilowii]